MKDSMVIYRSFYDAIKELPQQNQIEIWGAVHLFGFDGIEPELTGISKTIFTLIKPQIQANNRKAEIGKANGEKGGKFGNMGGRPKKEKPAEKPLNNPQGVFEITPSKPANVNVNVNNNENENEKENVNNRPHENSKVMKTAWWVKAEKEQVHEKVMVYKDAFPKPFLDQFINYYSMPHVNGGISINHETRFDIETKLKSWWAKDKDEYKEQKPASSLLKNLHV